MFAHLSLYEDGSLLAELQVKPSWISQVKERQQTDELLKGKLQLASKDGPTEFSMNEEGLLCFRGRVCMPKDLELRSRILNEAHGSAYAMHPGMHPRGSKMFRNLRDQFWWPGLKQEVTELVGNCLTCQQVKSEHQLPSGLLQPVKIPQWKWERITMDFVSGLPLTPTKKDAVWVVVDRLTKSAHFIPVRVDYSLQKLAKLYIAEVVRLHGVPISIISDRDPRFTSRFWKALHQALGTKLDFSTAFHPQTDGQPERVIQILEDMLRGCVIDFRGSWEEFLRLAEFAYNNSYQSSIQMAPYEALYGRRCRTPTCTGGGAVEKGIKGKLSPRFIGPYRVLKRVGPVAYQLELPPELSQIHNVFHVSMLRRYHSDPSHVVLVEEIEVRSDLSFEEELVEILDCDVKVLRRKTVPLVKVLWRNHDSEEATWEPEEAMQQQYPYLFRSGNFEDEISLRG
ncbi:DNA/RNA polymerases superfamily protein [Gossypium australe]|uniref:DNA/RNA polymerases superfamily protein n=1 Tax=Gossypium australe TaxID=47621 RepID=A0A5B6UQW9_9ROSI|nr:DNA/RNA polymerases superfamily protein [Gossypium australe]